MRQASTYCIEDQEMGLNLKSLWIFVEKRARLFQLCRQKSSKTFWEDTQTLLGASSLPDTGNGWKVITRVSSSKFTKTMRLLNFVICSRSSMKHSITMICFHASEMTSTSMKIVILIAIANLMLASIMKHLWVFRNILSKPRNS